MIKRITMMAAIGLTATIACAQATAPAYQPPAFASSGNATFDAWRQDFARRAVVDAGLPAAVVEANLVGLTPDDTVVRLNNRQPEFVLPIWRYLSNAISDARVAQGRGLLAQKRAILADVSAETGAPIEAALAIWAMESNFGRIKGDMDVVRSLATLAYDGRRTELGNRELLDAMRILASGAANRRTLVGSWAGAMGHTQFMPSSYLALGRDGDHDGRIDIWNDENDALASTLNYLGRRGWAAGLPWGAEVRLPANFDWALLDGQKRPLQEWQAQGVTFAAKTLGHDGPYRLLVPAGASGPAFLVSRAYESILSYNASDSYALAVAILSDLFVGQQGVVGAWPTDDPPIGGADARALQQGLNTLGYDVGVVDGVIGRQTRAKLAAFQRDHGHVGDGYASRSALLAIEAALAERAVADTTNTTPPTGNEAQPATTTPAPIPNISTTSDRASPPLRAGHQ